MNIFEDIKKATENSKKTMEIVKKQAESDKNQKENKKLQDYMKKYRLTQVDENDLAVIRQIIGDLTGLDQMNLATVFSKASDQIMVSHFSAILKQNWIIIRKLSEISQRLAGATPDVNTTVSNSREFQNNKIQSSEEGDKEQNEWGNRKLCSDEKCIGVIGADGKCTECGK
jgi:hypothetical protein